MTINELYQKPLRVVGICECILGAGAIISTLAHQPIPSLIFFFMALLTLLFLLGLYYGAKIAEKHIIPFDVNKEE